jgi:hypothetical protein
LCTMKLGGVAANSVRIVGQEARYRQYHGGYCRLSKLCVVSTAAAVRIGSNLRAGVFGSP